MKTFSARDLALLDPDAGRLSPLLRGESVLANCASELAAGVARSLRRLFALGFLLGVLVASAVADITVTTASDGGAGSLRDAVQNLVSGETITFAPALGGQTITLASDLAITKTVTINATNLATGITISGNSVTRIFSVAANGNLTVRGVTLTGGNGSGTVESTRGGAIHNLGTLALERCTLSGNTSTPISGGALWTTGTAALTQCTLSGNASGNLGGAIVSGGATTLTHCTISGNTATNFGGGVMISGGTTTLKSCIVSKNTAANGADLWSAGPAGGITRVGANIISVFGKTPDAPDNGPAANTADPLLGPLAANGGPTRTMALLAYSQAIDAAGDVTTLAGAIDDTATSLTVADGAALPAGNFILQIDLEQLAVTGKTGNTLTVARGANSTLQTAHNAGAPVNPATDQRGLPRILGSAADLGAYESGDANFTAAGLTLFARVSAALAGTGGYFEISDNASFTVPATVDTLVGTAGTFGAANGPRREAMLGYPSGVAQDSLGNIFVADSGNNLIRMLDPDGVVSTIAGTGAYGLANGPGLSAAFAFPSAIAVGPDDNVYVADTFNHRVCKLTRPTTGGEWTVTTLAGSGTAGFVNGIGTSARFNKPYGLDLDAAGNVYVADSGNHRIRKVTPAGAASTFAGSGTAGLDAVPVDTATLAKFNVPQGLVIVGKATATPTMFVADRANNCLRRILTTSDASGLIAGQVSTPAGSLTGVAGSADGTGNAARFNSPSGLAADANRNLFVADEQNHRIRRVMAFDALVNPGAVTTIAGSGTPGFVNGAAATAQFMSPTGLLVAADGTLVVADSQNHLLRTIPIDPLRVRAFADLGNVNAVGVQVSAVLDLATLGLSPDVRYYFRYRQPDATTQSFIQVPLPDVATVAADGLTPTAGRMKGTVDPNNLPTTVVLEYSTEPTLLEPYVVTAVAGAGTAGFLDSATATLARFSNPQGLAVSGGNVYMADFQNHRIRKIDAAGVVSTFAGSAANGLVNGTGAAAKFDRPAGIAAEPDITLLNCATVFGTPTVTCANTAGLVQGASVRGTNIAAGATILSIVPNTSFNLSANATGTSSALTLTAGGAAFYVADEFNHCIRKITASGQVTVLAGSGVAGLADGAPGVARFLFPTGVALDAASPPNVYVADSGNHCIRRVTPSGVVSTFAGTGVAGFANGPVITAQFSSPQGVAVTPAGDLLVADTGNHLVRAVSGGNVTTFAGTTQGFADGPGASAKFDTPVGVAIAADGTAFVSDSGNHRIRRVTVGAEVSTYAGSGIAGAINSPTNGLYPIGASQFNLPAGIAVDGAGGVLVTQEGLVRRIARGALPTVACPPVRTGTATLPINGDVSGLLPGTTYYFRAKGTCLQATVTGAILSFTTPAAPITVNEGTTIAGTEVLSGQATVLDFGSTPLGTPVARQFLISNPNGTPFTVTSINVPAGYQLTGGTGVNLVAPGGTLVFEITLLANATGGTKGGPVVINSDAPGLGTFTFPITGVVLAPPTVTTLAATGNASGNATLNGTVNPQGSATDVWFQWSLTGQFDGVLVSTVAGATTGFAEGVGTAALFNQPNGIAGDTSGNVFVADTKNHRIRRIAADGTVSTFAGTGVAGFAEGAGASAQFNEPTSLAMGSTGTLFVCDSLNHRIRAITPGGVVSTYAGFLGEAGFTDGVAGAARFSTPWGVASDAAGVLYVADRENHRIRRVATDGSVSTLAGTGVAGTTNGAAGVAQFDRPLFVAVDAAGSVYVTETASHAIRRVAPDGTTSIFSGLAATSGFVNGTAAAARFSSPRGLAVDGGGSVFVADRGNHSIRKITSTVGTGGAVTLNVVTFAGLGTAGTANGLKSVAQFDSPIALFATSDRGVIVGELTNSTIRKVTPTEPLLAAATGLTGTAVLPVSLLRTGLTIGTNYSFRAVATNARGTNYGNAFSFVAGTPFELWQLAKFGANASDPLIAGVDATPAHDGIANRLKYALGLDPLTDAVGSLPDVTVNGAALTITYNKVLAATDILYTVEWSADLLTWNTAGLTEQVFPPVGGLQQIITSIPIAPQRVKFLRLTVTFPTP